MNITQLELFNQACHQYKGMVISSDFIQAALLSRYQITPAEFLRPFLPRKLQRLKLGLREKEKELNIKLLDLKEYDQIGNVKLDKYSRLLLEDTQFVDQVQISRNCSKQVLDQICDQNKMAGFQQLQQVVGDCLGFQYHYNFLDHPIVLFYIVSGQEKNLIQEIHKIRNESNGLIKMIFKNNLNDLDMVSKVIIILNDAQEIVQYESLDLIFKEFSKFRAYTLKYNLPNPIEQTHWSRFSYQRYNYDGEVPKHPLGILDEQWTKIYRQVVEEIILQQAVIILERQINIQTQLYQEMKQKTFDTFLTSIFNTRTGQQTETEYKMSQREQLLRFLGDNHFLMNDYESAATYYKGLITELKNNKTNTTIATLYATEYYLYSRLLAQQKIDNLKNIFDEIQVGYHKIVHFPYMLRVMFFYIITIHMFGKYSKEQIYFLQRFHRYFKDLGSTTKKDYFVVYQILVYEQIAFIHLRLDPPEFRKFAHNLTLVANKYESENFKKHALRCFKIVEQLYQQSKWVPLLFWLEGHIGANCLENQRIQEAIDSFKLAFNQLNERQTLELHNQLVVDWKKAYTSIEQLQDHRRKYFTQSNTNLKIPIVKGPVDMLTHGLDVLDSIVLTNIKQKFKNLWNTVSKNESFFEDASIRSFDSIYLEERITCFNKSPCILNADKITDLIDKINKFGRQCFAEDTITLRFFINLPLKVPSYINGLQVMYQFYTLKENLLDLEANNEKEYILTKINTLEIKDIPFQRAVQEYIEVSITPPQAGYLIITGLQWNFLNIPAQISINYDAKDQSKKKSVNFYNKFKVFPKFIPIDIEYYTKPVIAYGEIRPILFKFTNKNPEEIVIHITPIIPYHFGFEEKKIILSAFQVLEYQFYLRCSFQEEFVGQLLFKYQQGQSGGIRVQKLEIPMKVDPSFKISLQTDLIVDYWKFTLQVQDYFGGKGNLKFDRILCLNENWKYFDVPYQSSGDPFLLTTFKLKKIQTKDYRYEEYQNRLKERFYREGDNFNEIILGDQGIPADVALDFVNLDIQHYFNVFYQKLSNQKMEEFPLFIIARWTYRLEDEIIYGLHELPVLQQNYLHRDVKEFPMSFSITAPFEVQHQSMITMVPIKISFKNTKYVDPISFTVTLFNGDEPLKSINDIQQPFFLWEGILQHQITLKPQEMKVLNLESVFTEKGVYDLSRFRLTMHNKQQNEYYSIDHETVIIKII
ncbi:unnamed protein product [Paramecium primaurelia]|uniref:TPPC8 C-terminal Ig-like domain-containing protein n=1 Tax=Paramecium primaurelia TaxID=5886 RepID=A0A8S1LZD7_PARPR|nr:unnamed protein product [Paramecium primaurelia]